jgi:tetratricopeptide (TPR) repeat protein/TolB-like protein
MVGQTISHYKIVEKLGEGGMGVVYKAEDTKLKRTVALKFLPSEFSRDPDVKARFIHEAQAASALQHNNICTIHDIDETDEGQMFICMDCYEGETLKQRLERGPIEADDIVQVGIQIADGLNWAHEAGIVHRDIKPANIILTKHGEVKILDFGIAKLGDTTQLTKTHLTPGTVSYMSPEQVRGEGTDHRSDLFSVGVVLYELATRRRPFVADHEAAVFYSIVNTDPEPPSRHCTNMQPGLEKIIMRLLQKDPAHRYQSASDLSRDLRQLLGMTTSSQGTAASALKSGRSPLTYALAGLVLLLVLFGIPPVRTLLEKIVGVSVNPAEKLVAVLPFTNIGNDPTNQVYCDGFTEIVTYGLMQLRSRGGTPLSVVPSIEIRGDTIKTAEKAYQRFGATLVLTGIVERDTDQVHIIMNLIDAQNLRQLNSKSIDARRLTHARLQDTTVSILVAMLDVPVEPTSLRMASLGGTNVSDANDFYILGRGYLSDLHRKGNVDFAIQQFDKALKEDSSFALAFAGLGEAYWRKYELTKDPQWTVKAMGSCLRATELNSQLPQVRMTLALIYTGTGKYEEAVSEYQTILERDSSNFDARRGLASTYKSWQKFDEAEKAFKKAIGLKPSYWGGHLDLGSFYYFRKRYAEAVEEFKRVVDLTPDNTGGYNGLGASYFKLERYEEAEEAFKKSIAIEPTYRLYNNLATLYFEQRRLSDAIPVYEKALAINDRDYRVWANLASAYYWTGQRDSARTRFEKTIGLAEAQRSVNPKDATVLSQLADYYSMFGKNVEALNLIKQAIELAPEDLEVISRSVDIYAMVGQRTEAISWMEIGLKKGILTEEFEKDPELKQLRNDGRYQELIKRYNKNP